jgi:PEP-CTERM motif
MDRSKRIAGWKASFAAAGIASVILTFGARPADADLLFDRGLPTANLNNAAGSDRSNVAWGDVNPVESIGDNFSLTQNSIVTTIQVWVVGSPVGTSSDPAATNTYVLWLGTDSGATSSVTETASSSSVTAVTYSDGSPYQGSSGDSLQLYEVDFSGLDLDLTTGTYAFGVSGPSVEDDVNTPFLSASNGALSGSTQEGDDGLVYGFDAAGNMVSGYPFDSEGNGWDKSSDVNVQVFGTPVPEPTSMALLGAALLGFAGIGYRRRRKV